MVSISEKKIKIGENFLNFVFAKIENSKPQKCLFLIPGGIEHSWSAFELQLKNLPILLPNYQIITYDPLGLGKSRPPYRRNLREGIEIKDVENIVKFMDQMNIEKFSVLGWSYGGTVAVKIAINYPSRVEKLIITTSSVYVSETSSEVYKMAQDLSFWPEKVVKPFIDLYGAKGFKEMWENVVEYFVNEAKTRTIEKAKEVGKIQAQTLIFHAKKDFIVEFAASKFLNDNIKGSKLIVMEDASHNLHIKYYQEFNQLVADFLNEKSKL